MAQAATISSRPERPESLCTHSARTISNSKYSIWSCNDLGPQPSLDAFVWCHNQVLMPLFDGLGHSSIIWHEFQMIAGILYKGSNPTAKHYQAVLFNSGCRLLCNDNRPPSRLVRKQSFYEEIYILWLTPWSTTRMEFRRPLPLINTTSTSTTLAMLISKHFN